MGRINRVVRELGVRTESVDELPSGGPARAEHELMELVLEDAALASVLARFGATVDTLRSIYRDLLFTGAGQWEGGVYVAAAALLTPQTLAFVLEHAKTSGPEFEEAWARISFGLIEYFRTRDPRYLSDDPAELR
jgi:hypothetical protein